jgi:hypothetical protein
MAAVAEKGRPKIAESARHGQHGIKKRDGGNQDRERSIRMCGDIARVKIEREVGERKSEQCAA